MSKSLRNYFSIKKKKAMMAITEIAAGNCFIYLRNKILKCLSDFFMAYMTFIISSNDIEDILTMYIQILVIITLEYFKNRDLGFTVPEVCSIVIKYSVNILI